jgi:hypothetical protein
MLAIRLLARILIIVLGGAGISAAQSAVPSVRAVSVQRQADATIVIIQATGPLPAPSVGEVDGPPRVFFDFAGVACTARGVAAAGHPAVRRVRAAVHSATPLLTRVVIDLIGDAAISLESDQLASGILRVRVTPRANTPASPPLPSAGPPSGVAPVPESAAAAAAPAPGPAPPAPPPPPASVRPDPITPPVPAATSAAAPPPAATGAAGPAAPARDVERYRRFIADALGRLLTLRPLLASIDQFASPPPDELQMAADEFDRIVRVVSIAQPPPALRTTHDLLVRASSLAAVATRLRAEANRTSDIGQVRNAGSAAAGARLLLERVCTELGCDNDK